MSPPVGHQRALEHKTRTRPQTCPCTPNLHHRLGDAASAGVAADQSPPRPGTAGQAPTRVWDRGWSWGQAGAGRTHRSTWGREEETGGHRPALLCDRSCVPNLTTGTMSWRMNKLCSASSGPS